MCEASCYQMSSVLGCPARGTGEGGGHHDGGGLGHAAHGTGNIVVKVAWDLLVLCTVQLGKGCWLGLIVKLWCHGQAESIGGSSSVIIKRTSNHT